MWYSNPYELSTDQSVPIVDLTDEYVVTLSIVLGIFIIGSIITIICHTRESASSCRRNKRILCCNCCGCIDTDRRLKSIGHDMGSDCAICLEPKDSKTKPVVMVTCNHSYHQACISRCLQMEDRAKCPQCRRQPGQYSTTERFIAIIKTLVIKRKERTLEAKTMKRQQAEEEDKTILGQTDLRIFSSCISPDISPVAVTIV